MRKNCIIKGYWARKHQKIKNYHNPIASWIISFMIPIFLHLSITSFYLRYLWLIILSLSSIYLLIISKKLFLLAVLLVIIYLLHFARWNNNENITINEQITFNARIVKTSEKYTIISYKNVNLLFYQNKFNTAENLYAGNTVEIKGIPRINEEKYNDFFNKQNIDFLLEKPIVLEVKKPKLSIENLINNYCKNQPILFQKYWKLIIFGSNDNVNDIKQNAIKLNIIHLLVISGIHFDLIYKIFTIFINKIKNKKMQVWVKVLSLIISFYYLCLIPNFIPPLRAFIMYIFKIFKKNKWIGLATSSLITFYINFYLIYNYSFILTYSVTSIIMLINNLKIIRNRKNVFFKYLLVSFLISVFTLLFNIKFNKSINLLGMIWVILFTPLIEFVYLCSLLFWFSPQFLSFIHESLDLVINLAVKLSPILILNIEISEVTLLIWYTSWVIFLLILFKHRYFCKKQKN
ncbi:MAG0480 family ComEC-like protein [Mycoplasma zalophidermidis]|uniref:MAG0480 family ComEC-like protein n=1 Tax=Mycoplasma zalophidermidis TaxID=398174 RepID=UPI00358F8ADD